VATYLNNLGNIDLKGLDERIQTASQATINPHIDFITHTEQHRVAMLTIVEISV
jgi:hypothetical protein